MPTPQNQNNSSGVGVTPALPTYYPPHKTRKILLGWASRPPFQHTTHPTKPEKFFAWERH
ncbi:hypothetical protein [Microseira wollei]|uniref:hypothetical protein n=1 Tax=Microseira wollei TaxID=467598 RepID=UPI001CFED163|nr:hypothetical protein [Microseira wollei]